MCVFRVASFFTEIKPAYYDYFGDGKSLVFKGNQLCQPPMKLMSTFETIKLLKDHVWKILEI